MTIRDVASQFKVSVTLRAEILTFWHLRGCSPALMEALSRTRKQSRKEEKRVARLLHRVVKEQMLKVADRVDRAEIFEECGHSLALEADQRLASLLREFMLNQ